VKSHDSNTARAANKASPKPKAKAKAKTEASPKATSPSAKKRTGTSPSGKKDAKMCHFYTKEKCKNGDNCDFYHVPTCRNFQTGTCKKGNDCLYHHPGKAAAATEAPAAEEVTAEKKKGRGRSSSPSPKASGNLAVALCAILTLCSSPGAEAHAQFASNYNSTAYDDYRQEGGQFAFSAHSRPASLSVQFSDELIKIAEQQEANPSLNVIQPPSGNVASCDKVHYADGPRIDASILVFDTNKAKKRAWDLNIELFPRSTSYFKELNIFFRSTGYIFLHQNMV